MLSAFWVLIILIVAQWHLVVLMTYDVERLFICLFAMYMPSLMRFLFIYFAHFIIWLFVFLLLNFKSSLHVLNTSPLSNMCFENISF